MHLVVFDLERRDTGALPLARFQFEQEGAAVVLQGAKLVELGVEPRGDHAAVAHQRRRFVRERALQERECLGGHGQGVAQRGEARHLAVRFKQRPQLGQAAQRGA